MRESIIDPGHVWLVGAGPGDPDLLTVKALRLLGAADIVFYDALVGEAILGLIPDGVEIVGVGKRSGQHSKPQQEINRLMAEAAVSGRRVVRLKGGDPSIFGRSAEEADHLAARGIPVHICPGVTAATAAAAAARASLSRRGAAQGVTFVTAHAQAGGTLDLDWPQLATASTTLAIYMGRESVATIAAKLIEAGRRPDTPVIVACDVSLPSERILHGRLDGLAFLVRTISGNRPTLLIIGEAVDRRVVDGVRHRADCLQPALG